MAPAESTGERTHNNMRRTRARMDHLQTTLLTWAGPLCRQRPSSPQLSASPADGGRGAFCEAEWRGEGQWGASKGWSPGDAQWARHCPRATPAPVMVQGTHGELLGWGEPRLRNLSLWAWIRGAKSNWSQARIALVQKVEGQVHWHYGALGRRAEGNEENRPQRKTPSTPCSKGEPAQSEPHFQASVNSRTHPIGSSWSRKGSGGACPGSVLWPLGLDGPVLVSDGCLSIEWTSGEPWAL